MKRLVLLPSNGAEYGRIATITGPTNRDVLSLSASSFGTLFDFYAHVVTNFCHVDGLAPERMLLTDMYFVYLYIFYFMFPHEDEDPFFPTIGACKCGNTTKLSLKASGLEYTYRNPFSDIHQKYESVFIDHDHEVRILLRARTIADNIELVHLCVDPLSELFDLAITYVLTSTSSLIIDNEEIPQHQWRSVFDGFTEANLMTAYALALDVSRAGCGLSRTIEYQCDKCNETARSFLFNDIVITSPSAAVPVSSDPVQQMTNFINSSRYRIASYDELLLMPASESKHFFSALSNTKFVPTMAGMF